jgi:hypothetical protein
MASSILLRTDMERTAIRAALKRIANLILSADIQLRIPQKIHNILKYRTGLASPDNWDF